MKPAQPYLTFDGNCNEAMTFYKEALGGDLFTMKYSDAPPDPNMPYRGDRLVHAALNAPGTMDAVLMASDCPPGMNFKQGNSIMICLDCASPDEQDKWFAAMGKGGQVTMPVGEVFWGARFGMLTDKFGIGWMFSYRLPPKN